MYNVSFIKKFRFNSFNDNAYEEISTVNYADYNNSQIINVFLMDNPKTLAVLTIKKCFNENEYDENPGCEFCYCDKGYYTYIFLKLYNQDLKYIPYFKIGLEFFHYMEYIELNKKNEEGEENNLFCKSMYISMLNKPYIFFVYFFLRSFLFQLFEINIEII